MSGGYTVSPNIDANGNVSGFNIDGGHGSATDRQGQVTGWQNDYVQDQAGSIHHVMENTELGGDPNQDVFNMDSYADDLRAVNPELDNIIDWMDVSPSITDYTRQQWNNAIDAGDLDTINSLMEQLSAMYVAEGGHLQVQDKAQEREQQDHQTTREENWFDNVADQDINTEVDALIENPPSYDDEQMYASALQNYTEGTAEHDILACATAISRGDMNMDEAFKKVIGAYGEGAAAAAYVRLQNYLN